MKDLIKYIDYFGVTFQFNTQKNKKYTSILGGILTTICLLLIITFGFLFGRDFYLKRNPKMNEQMVFPLNYSEAFTLSPENIVVPWRLMDTNSQSVDFKNKIFPLLIYEKAIINSTGTHIIYNEALPYSKCNSQNVKVNITSSYKLDDYFCFDWSKGDYTFGGYWDGSYVDYFYIALSTCENSLIFSKNIKCSSTEELYNIFLDKNLLYFELLYPEVSVVPDNIDSPLITNYNSHFFNFSPKIFRFDRFYFNKVQISDDLGWIIENPRDRYLFSMSNINSDFTFFETSMFNKEGYGSIFYIATFYMKKSFKLYKRSFMKVQDLAALVGGFMKIVLFIGRLVSQIYNHISYDNFLFSQLYECTYDDSHKKNLKESHINIDNFLEEKDSRSNINQNKGDIHLANIKKLKRSPTKNLITNFKISQKETKLFNFGIYFKFKKVLGCINDNTCNQKKVYKILYDNLLHKKDALFYFHNISVLEKIKEILFNHNQALSFNFLKLPNIAEEKQLQEVQENTNYKNGLEYDRVFRYFSEKSEKKDLDGLDLKILPHLDPDLAMIKTINNQQLTIN
jgi:hypothetical protein